MADTLRDRIAWLMWCANEGYLTDADRAGVSNIFTADPATLHPDDAFSLPRWREMADAILAAPGIAVVELPEPDGDGDSWEDAAVHLGRAVEVPRIVYVEIDPGDPIPLLSSDARGIAAALLAAADKAEEGL